MHPNSVLSPVTFAVSPAGGIVADRLIGTFAARRKRELGLP
jgi:hypothetical protein